MLFVLLSLLFSPSFASECRGVSEQVGAAWDAFYDAELELAKQTVSDAVQSLGCQADVVDTETLLELYRVDALISLTKEDRKSSVYATIRAVTVDPSSGPPTEMGPELADLYADWSARLGDSKVMVRLLDDGEAWIDGRPLVSEVRLEVVAGEHLIQFRKDGMVKSIVEEVTSNWVVVTGEPVGLVEGAAPVSTGPDPISYEDKSEETESVAAAVENLKKRRRFWELGLAGGLTTASGGLLLGLSVVEEQKFQSTIYMDAQYGDCSRDTDCYQSEREQAIRSDANRVRLMYGAAYGLVTAGLATSLAGIIGIPVVVNGRTIGLQVEF